MEVIDVFSDGFDLMGYFKMLRARLNSQAFRNLVFTEFQMNSELQ